MRCFRLGIERASGSRYEYGHRSHSHRHSRSSGFPLPSQILLPLPVLGELFAGAYASARTADNLAALERVVAQWVVISPDHETAREYGRVRCRLREMADATQARRNDLWIAALCIQHDLPLLTNDRGFDVIHGLTVVRG